VRDTSGSLCVTDPEGIPREDVRSRRGPGIAAEIMSQIPRALQETVATHPSESWRARPFPGRGTPIEIIGHLVDTQACWERVGTCALRAQR
jgi:hypothetical protein